MKIYSKNNKNANVLIHFKKGKSDSFIEDETGYRMFYELVNRKVLFGLYGSKDSDMGGFYSNPIYALNNAPRLQFNFTQKKNKSDKNWISFKKFILIDVDKFNYEKFNLLDLPIKPQVIIANPKKPQSIQLIYWLTEGVFGNNAKESNLYNFCFENLNNIYDGDVCNVGYIAKNPFCSDHLVLWLNDVKQHSINSLYTEIKSYLLKTEAKEITKPKPKPKPKIKKKTGKILKLSEQDKNSRNYKLFNELRLIAYQFVDDFIDLEDSEERFIAFLINQAKSELSKKEIEKTVKSIAKYTLKNHIKDFSNSNNKYIKINEEKKERKMKAIEFLKTNYDLRKRFSAQEKLEISKLLKVKPKTVELYLSLAKKDLREKETDLDKIIAYRQKKLSWKDIALLMNKSISAIQKMYYRHTSNVNKNNNYDLFN